MLLAIAAAGAGHGTYLVAGLLFPFTMLSTVWTKSITAPFMILACVQFPLYGAVIGSDRSSAGFRMRAFAIGAIHLIAFIVVLAFGSSAL